MAKRYGDHAEFYVVYIREAHPADSKWPIPIKGEDKIYLAKTYADRKVVANKCVTKLHIELPCLVDDVDNAVAKSYDAFPDRLFVVDTDGTIAVRADRGPWGFGPGVDEATKWLAKRFPGA